MIARGWRTFATAVSRSPALTVTLIAATALASVFFEAILTPPANVSAVPFILPTLIAMFQGPRWVWVTALVMIGLYIPVAFVLESVAFTAGTINILGLMLFGVVFSRVAEQRQRLWRQADALLQMEENLKLAMRNSNVRLFSHDTELRYTWVPNPLPAFPHEEMIGATDESLFPPAEARELMDIKRRAIEEEREIHQQVTVMRDGEARVHNLVVVPIWENRNGDRIITGITCVSVDVTELENAVRQRDELVQRQEQALGAAWRSQQNLESFTSMIAHDLMQPVTVIQGNVELVQRRLGPDLAEPEMRALNSMTRAVQQMNRLVDDLRDVAALEQGRFTLHTADVDLVGVVTSVVSDYQDTTPTHQITSAVPAELYARVDAHRLSQLIGNLLSNAIKYSPQGSEIRVSLVASEGSCVIEVSDQGLGMTPEEVTQLFEMFSRLDNSRSIQGLGLGLYISRGIAEAHNGTITVESEPGRGSTFKVMLPISSGGVPPARRSSEEGSAVAE